MSLTTEQLQQAANSLSTEIFGKQGVTAHSNGDDVIAAIQSIDDAMDTTISNIPAGWQSKTIKQALIDNLPEPFQTESTGAQKATAMALWAMIEANII